MTRRLASWLAVAALGLSMLVFAAVDEGPPLSNADRAYSLAQDFACPVCQGQSVAESDVVVARNIRREIRVWVDEGRSDAFIRDQKFKIGANLVDKLTSYFNNYNAELELETN